jgi:hypothetical protein
MSSSVMRHWSFGAALALGMALSSCRLEKQPRPKVTPAPGTSTQTETASSQRSGTGTVNLPSESSPSSRPAAATRSSAHDILTLLRNLKDAADQNDHDAFNSDLAEARASASVLPSGTQKSGVDELLKTYGDLARVWDYVFASTSGSFFDEQTQNGSLLSTLRAYPGFDEYIARRTLVDPASGHRYYPSRETRDFLSAYAGQQLSRLGISAPVEIPRTAASVPTTSPTPTSVPPVASTSQRPPVSASQGPSVSTSQRPSVTAPEQPSPSANSTPAVKRASSGSAAGSSSSSRKHSGRSVTTAKTGSRSQSSGNHSAGNEKAASAHPTASATRPPAIAASTTQVSPLDSLAAAAAQRSTSTEPPVAPSTPSNTGSTGTASTTAIVTSTSTSTSGTTATDLLTPSSTDTATTSTASEPSSSSAPGTPRRASGILTIIMVIVGIGVLALLIRASR